MTTDFDKTESFELNRRIQGYLRATALANPNHERIGPFLAGFAADDANPYRNYAVPDDGASPDRAEVEALIAAFARRKRKPRLEYIPASAPAVEPALVARGFAIEKRYPLMISGRAAPAPIALPEFTLSLAQGDADIVEAAEVGAEAYNDDEPHPDPLRRLVAQGGVLGIARDIATGVMAGTGMATPRHDGVTEVAGIGVRNRFRRRGIAGALTAMLAQEAFARGASLAWLVPGDEAAERIYARGGFRRASEQLHISREAPPE